MVGLKKRNGGKLPLIGDMLFSVLVLPCAFNCIEKWLEDSESEGCIHWLCVVYAMIGAVHLFRAFRLRERSRAMFYAHLVYAVSLSGCAVALGIFGKTEAMTIVLGLVFWAWMLVDRVIAMAYRRRLWSILFNVLAILLILVLMITAFFPYSLSVVLIVAYLWALVSVMVIAFSRMRLDVLKEIIRKTYAVEIMFGLLLLIVAFSYVLKYVDPAFNSFEDGLWYCFAVVTTIGFGDVTPTSSTGRLLSVILGLYGIVVVALITSIIVNFYSEMKRDNTPEKTENDGIREQSE